MPDSLVETSQVWQEVEPEQRYFPTTLNVATSRRAVLFLNVCSCGIIFVKAFILCQVLFSEITAHKCQAL